MALCLSHVGGRRLQCSTLYAAVGGHEALPRSNLVFQLLVHSLGISGFEQDPHYCQLPVAEEVQPDRNSSCPAVLTVVWIVLDSNYARQTSDNFYQGTQSLPIDIRGLLALILLQALTPVSYTHLTLPTILLV